MSKGRQEEIGISIIEVWLVDYLHVKRLVPEFLNMPFTAAPDRKKPEIACFLCLNHRRHKNVLCSGSS